MAIQYGSAKEELLTMALALRDLQEMAEDVMHLTVEYEKVNGRAAAANPAERLGVSAWALSDANMKAITALGRAVGYLLTEEDRRASGR